MYFLKDVCKYEMKNTVKKYTLQCTKNAIHNDFINEFCFFVFIITSIVFAIIGLKSPLLLGLFCGITNVIPYAGPYIGGAPAVIVGLSQGIPTGIFTFLVVALIQFLEGNFLQPLIMSKTTKLHPVTIMLGLLIFGYFWGIMGMVLSTPIIAAAKAIIVYLDEKYDFLSYND